MRIPHITSLYGRIFAIFWFTIFLVLLAVLSLSQFDPRKVRDIPKKHYHRLLEYKNSLESHFKNSNNLSDILSQLEKRKGSKKSSLPRYFITDKDGSILSAQKPKDERYKKFENFVSATDSALQKPKQRLYGQYMIAGPIPIDLASQPLNLYIGFKIGKPPLFLLRALDRPFQLLFAIMLISTPLLLWLAWALSQPARKLERAAKRVAKGEFIVDPELEKGTKEFHQAGASFNQMVEAVNQMMSGQQRLLSDISHELRSPLTRLRMANALATRKQGQSPELARIDIEAERLEQMISELLTLSRMQVDSHLSREVQSMDSLWEAILSDAQFEAEQVNKTLTFNKIPEGMISGNPKLLMSALDNVVRNAIYYGKDKIDICFTVSEQLIHIAVDDNGEGLPDDDLDAIFRPFYRVSTARDRNSGGTGLGLAITENAIRQHSGTVVAKSSQFGGLRIEISLPITVLK